MSAVANIREWLEEWEKDAGPIVAIVIGPDYTADYGSPLGPDEGIVLSREDGLQKLDVVFDNGYGGADCRPIFAWTERRVAFIQEYDGSTGLAWVPRHPLAIAADFNGL